MSFDKSELLKASQGLSISPDQISSGLNRIRREAAEIDASRDLYEGRDAKPRVRATLSNLILVVDGANRSECCGSLDSLIEEICIAHPSRFFVVELCDAGSDTEADKKEPLESTVSSRCVLSHSGVHVCSEEVYLSVRDAGIPLVRNLLLSLLLPDIPTLVVLLCDPRSRRGDAIFAKTFDKLISSLESISDRLLFDSEFFENYYESVSAVVACRSWHTTSKRSVFGRAAGRELLLEDIYWQRLKIWRTLVAEQFDGQRPKGGGDIAAVGFEVNGMDGTKAADVLLMAGWFVSVLSWTVLGAELLPADAGVRMKCAAQNGQEVVFDFVCSKDDSAGSSVGGSLASIRISLTGGQEMRLRPQSRQIGERDIKRALFSRIVAHGRDVVMEKAISESLRIGGLEVLKESYR